MAKRGQFWKLTPMALFLALKIEFIAPTTATSDILTDRVEALNKRVRFGRGGERWPYRKGFFSRYDWL